MNETITCDGQCEMGACHAPTCTDGIMDGDEEGVDCGGRCGDCGFVAISGRILYEEMTADMTASLGLFPGGGSISACMMTAAIFPVGDNQQRRDIQCRDPRKIQGGFLKIRIGDCSHFKEGFINAVRIARDYDSPTSM